LLSRQRLSELAWTDIVHTFEEESFLRQDLEQISTGFSGVIRRSGKLLDV
jgi:hypothetical protein